MNNITKYKTLLSKSFHFQSMNDIENEDEILCQMDRLWYDEMTEEDRQKARELVYLSSKEKYVGFINAWKAFIKDKNHLKYKVPTTVVVYDKEAKKWKSIDHEKQYYWRSDLKTIHHLIYSLLRNRNINQIFKSDKMHGLTALIHAQRTLKWAAKHASADNLEYILKPFGGHIGVDELKLASDRLEAIMKRTSNFSELEKE